MRDFKGFVRRESSDRPVAAKGDDEAVFRVACAHMLYREEKLIWEVCWVAKRFYRECQVGLSDKASRSRKRLCYRQET